MAIWHKQDDGTYRKYVSPFHIVVSQEQFVIYFFGKECYRRPLGRYQEDARGEGMRQADTMLRAVCGDLYSYGYGNKDTFDFMYMALLGMLEACAYKKAPPRDDAAWAAWQDELDAARFRAQVAIEKARAIRDDD